MVTIWSDHTMVHFIVWSDIYKETNSIFLSKSPVFASHPKVLAHPSPAVHLKPHFLLLNITLITSLYKSECVFYWANCMKCLVFQTLKVIRGSDLCVLWIPFSSIKTNCSASPRIEDLIQDSTSHLCWTMTAALVHGLMTQKLKAANIVNQTINVIQKTWNSPNDPKSHTTLTLHIIVLVPLMSTGHGITQGVLRHPLSCSSTHSWMVFVVWIM